MKLEAMITGSKMDDILFDLDGDELRAISLLKGDGGKKVPLISANVSKDRYLEFIRQTNATPISDQGLRPAMQHAMFISAHTEAGDFICDNVTSHLGIWLAVGEGLE